MALTSTTLAKACSATDDRLKLTSATGIAVGMVIRVNDEDVLVTSIGDTPTIGVERGQNGTPGRAHNILSLAVYGYPYDFQTKQRPHMYTYGANGAITVAPGTHRLAKATAGAYTLRAPKADEEGLTMLLISETAAAHVVTLDSGVFNGETLSPALNFAAAIGNCIEIMAIGGQWLVTLNKNVTLPSTSASSSVSSSPSSSASSSASSSPSASVSSSPSSSVSSSVSSSPSSSASTS